MILAIVLRFYKLGTQRGMIVDETSVGYNAYSILKTGKDEFGKSWPLFFRSTGEGKLPVYVYQAVLPVAVFGLNTFAVRFAPALFGSLAVLMIYFLSKELFHFISKEEQKRFKKTYFDYVPILASLFMATMPWAVFFSRGVYGQEILFWMLLGAFLSLRHLRFQKISYWLWANIAFIMGLGSYHGAKAFVPLWIASILVAQLVMYRKVKQVLFLGLIALCLSGISWALVTFSPYGMARAADMSITSPLNGIAIKIWESESESHGQPILLTRILHNKVEIYARNIIQNYLSHFSGDFLFFKGEPHISVSIPRMGQLLLFTLPLLLIGAYWLFKMRLWPMILFLLLSPLSAALSYDVPSAARAILLIGPLAFIAGLGGMAVFYYLKKLPRKVSLTIIVGSSLLLVHNIAYFLDSYYVHAKYHPDEPTQYGNPKLMLTLARLSKEYPAVRVTEKLSDPYIFYLFYNKYDPLKWHPQSELNIEEDTNLSFIHIRRIDNIQFLDDICPYENKPQQKTLYACLAGKEPSDAKIIEVFNDQLGKPYIVLFTQKE